MLRRQLETAWRISAIKQARQTTRLRRTRPELTDPRFGWTTVDCDDDQRWLLIDRSGVRIAVNLADDARSVPTAAPAASILLQTRDGIAMTAEKLILPSQSATVLVQAVQ